VTVVRIADFDIHHSSRTNVFAGTFKIILAVEVPLANFTPNPATVATAGTAGTAGTAADGTATSTPESLPKSTATVTEYSESNPFWWATI
jgi:hypothetical protein